MKKGLRPKWEQKKQLFSLSSDAGPLKQHYAPYLLCLNHFMRWLFQLSITAPYKNISVGGQWWWHRKMTTLGKVNVVWTEVENQEGQNPKAYLFGASQNTRSVYLKAWSNRKLESRLLEKGKGVRNAGREEMAKRDENMKIIKICYMCVPIYKMDLIRYY